MPENVLLPKPEGYTPVTAISVAFEPRQFEVFRKGLASYMQTATLAMPGSPYMPRVGVYIPDPDENIRLGAQVGLTRYQEVMPEYGVALWAISMYAPLAVIVGRSKSTKTRVHRRFGAIIASDQIKQKVPLYYSVPHDEEDLGLDEALVASLPTS